MELKKALIIDDEEDFCLLLQEYLKRKRYEVTVRHTLQSGISTFHSLKPDILFLDNNLPDGLGWEQLPLMYSMLPETQYYLVSAFHPALPDFEGNIHLNVLEKPISFRQLEEFF